MSSSGSVCFLSSRTFTGSLISLAWLLVRLKFCFKYVTNNQLEFQYNFTVRDVVAMRYFLDI